MLQKLVNERVWRIRDDGFNFLVISEEVSSLIDLTPIILKVWKSMGKLVIISTFSYHNNNNNHEIIIITCGGL